MYSRLRGLGDESDLAGLGDESDLAGIDQAPCCNGCSGLAGMGLTLPTPEGEATQSEPWWLRAIHEAEAIAGKIVTPVPRLPTYTPPYNSYPTDPNNYTGTPAATNWTPYLIGGALLLFFMRGK